MTAAAAKHTALAAVAIVVLAMFAIGSSTAGAASSKRARDHEPPSRPANLRVTAATSSAVDVAWDVSTDNVGVAGYQVYVDGRRVRVDGTRFRVEGLGCGETAAVWIMAFDRARNRSAASSLTFSSHACVDVTPPTAPSRVSQAASDESSIVLKWRSSRDDVGVVGYGVYQNSLLIDQTSEPSTTLTGHSCGRTYQYLLDAVDAAGNRSEPRSAFVRTAPCSDSRPPSTPTDVVVTSSTPTSISLSWAAATDNVGVEGYRIRLEGIVVASSSQTAATLSGLACGRSYEVAVHAFDAVDNVSRGAAVAAATAACVSAPAPPAPAPAPAPPPPAPAPPAPVPPGDATPPSQPTGLAVASATRTSISLTWTAATDNVGVEGYSVYRNGARVATVSSRSATLSALACGTAYTLEVEAYDAAGNRSNRASLIATTLACADTSAPSAPGGVTATSRTQSSIALLWAASTDNVGVVGYGLYRAGTLVGTSTSTTGIFANLACNTNHTLAVDAYDAAGNRSAKTTVMVATTACSDTTAPSAPTGLAVSGVTQNALTLTWNASSDAIGVAGYDVYRNGAKVASVTSTTSSQSGLACATSYGFAVEAYDAAGNRSPRTPQVSASTSACPPPPPAPAPPLPTPPPTSGSVIFDGGWDSGDLFQWSFVHQYTPDRFRVVSSDGGATPRNGSHMARVEVRGGEPASWDASMNVTMASKSHLSNVGLGNDVYTGWSVYIPHNFPYVPNTLANLIVEWHAEAPMSQAPFHFGINGYNRQFFVDLHTAATGYSPVIQQDVGPLVTGRWVDCVLRTKWAQDASGVFEFWMDGVKRVSWTGRTWGTQQGVYPMAGYYRTNYNATAVIYIDALKVGTTYKSVAP